MLAIVFALRGATADADETTTAEEILRQQGLMHSEGQWRLPTEKRLSAQLDRLDRLEREIRDGRRAVQQRLARNRQLAARIDKTQAELEKALKSQGDAGGSGRSETEQRINSLRDSLATLQRDHLPGEKLAEDPEVRNLLRELSMARARLSVIVANAPRDILHLKNAYEKLRSDTGIQSALTALPDARLADARSHMKYFGRLADLKIVAWGGPVPAWREAGHWRVTGIISDRQVITMSIDHRDGPLLLPASGARAAGIEPAESGRLTYRLAGGRRILVQTAVARLRMGKHEFERLKVYILPPEAEDLGTRLGQGSVPDFRLLLEPEKLSISFKALD